MCGGGGGGDGGAEEREKERERKNRSATAQINSIFGIDDQSLYTTPFETKIPIRQKDAESGEVTDVGTRSEWTDQLNQELYDKARTNKTEREKLYSTSRQDILDYFTTDLNEQQTRNERLAREQAAQRGWTGGGHELAFNQDFKKTYDDALLNIGNRADAAKTEMVGADERSRQNLISQILSGMDEQSAITGATSALRQNIDVGKQSALQQSLGDVFGNVSNLYNFRTVADAKNKEDQRYQNAVRALGLDPASYSGNITRT